MKNPIKDLLGDEKYTELKKFVFGEQEMAEQAPQEDPQPEEKAKMGSATLEDGTVVQWEGELATGAALEVITAEGEAVAAPDGKHTVSDGTVIVTENGIITEILSSVEEMDESAKLLEEIQTAFEAFKSATDARIEMLESTLKQKDEELNTIQSGQEQFNKAILESVEFLAGRESEQSELKDKFGVSKEVEKKFNRNASLLLERLRKGSKFK